MVTLGRVYAFVTNELAWFWDNLVAWPLTGTMQAISGRTLAMFNVLHLGHTPELGKVDSRKYALLHGWFHFVMAFTTLFGWKPLWVYATHERLSYNTWRPRKAKPDIPNALSTVLAATMHRALFSSFPDENIADIQQRALLNIFQLGSAPHELVLQSIARLRRTDSGGIAINNVTALAMPQEGCGDPECAACATHEQKHAAAPMDAAEREEIDLSEPPSPEEFREMMENVQERTEPEKGAPVDNDKK